MTRSRDSVAAARNHDRAKRIALVSLRVVGAVVAAVAVVVGGLMIVLRTSWGGERLRRMVVGRVNQQIQGQLGIGRLAFGGDRLVVWDVTLRDPEGQPVAQVARAEVDFRVMRLLRKEVRLTAVIIEAPRLAVVSEPRGLNLTRAVAARENKPRQEPPRTGREGWVIRLDRFDLKDGDVVVASANPNLPGGRKEIVHVGALQSFISARYATGNGSTDLTFKLEGRSEGAPAGPLAIDAEARVRGDAVRVSVDGGLLGGTVKAWGDIDRKRLEAADAVVAIAIPRQALAGFDWGPLRIDAVARPGTVPRLDLLLAIPGVELTAKGGAGAGREVFKLDGRLALDDLAMTAKAARALAPGALPPASGHGVLGFTVEGPMAGAPASWSGGVKAVFDRLRVEDDTITDLTIDGHVAHLSSDPGEADVRVAIASARAGATKLRDIRLDAKVRRQEVTVLAGLAAPEVLSLGLAARLDDDRRGLALTRVALSYPQARWALAPASVGTARVRFDDQALSLANLRLESQGQELALEGSRSRQASRITAHLAARLRLDLLPALIANPALALGGTLDVDVAADGQADNPKLAARLRLEQGRFRKLSKIRARFDAKLANRHVDGTMGVDAPFAAVDGGFRLPVDLLAPGAPLDVRVDLARLDLGDALAGAGMPARADGKLTARLRVAGSAADPKVDLTVNGRDLDVRRPAPSPSASRPSEIDLGRVAVRLTYQDRSAHADVDFASAHGGTLRVNAGAGIDLGYPRGAKRIAIETLPVHGKVVARDFDMAWVAGLADRVQSTGGRLNADARLAGTVGDPRLVGDVRWKNGKVVVNARKPAAGAKRR